MRDLVVHSLVFGRSQRLLPPPGLELLGHDLVADNFTASSYKGWGNVSVVLGTSFRGDCCTLLLPQGHQVCDFTAVEHGDVKPEGPLLSYQVKTLRRWNRSLIANPSPTRREDHRQARVVHS